MQTPLLLLIAFALFSCHTPRYVYSPTPPNTPFFKQKGESKISAYWAGRIMNNRARHSNYGYDLQGAYAISNHWALTASHSKRNERDIYEFWGEELRFKIFDTSNVHYNRRLTEIGGGYFCPLDNSNELNFTVYGGIGFGKFSIDDKGLDEGVAYSHFYKTNVFKWYIQPGLNFMPGSHWNFSLASRFSFTTHNNASTSYTKEHIDYFRMSQIDSKTLFTLEPSWSLQFKIPKNEWMKLETGGTYALKLSTAGLVGRTRFSSYFVGVTFDPFSLFRK